MDNKMSKVVVNIPKTFKGLSKILFRKEQYLCKI